MHLARSILALIVFALPGILHASPVPTDVDGAGPLGSFGLSMNVTVKQHVRSDALNDACRFGFKIRGCTDFPREVIECDCVARGGAWVIEGRAIVDAVVHIATSQSIDRVMLHERTHIADLEQGLRAHLDSLEAKTFDTRVACDSYAKVLNESPHLRFVMNRLRIASNDKYGCARKGGS